MKRLHVLLIISIGVALPLSACAEQAGKKVGVELNFKAPTKDQEQTISALEHWSIEDAANIPNNPVKIEIAAFDLNADGKKEIFARLSAQGLCANLGCPLILYNQKGSELTPIQHMNTDEAVAISGEKHNGFFDLILNARRPLSVQCRLTWNGLLYDTSDCQH